MDQFRYIWNARSVYFYHVDLKAPEALHRLVATLAAAYDNVFVVPSLLCSWGGFSLVEAMLQIAAWSVGKAKSWTHLVYLSEQHLPLRSHADCLDRLELGYSYLACTPMSHFSGVGLDDLRHRFSQDYREVPGVGGFPVGRHQDRQFETPPGLHHGSQWMILSRQATMQLAANRADAFWDVFRRSLLADETATQTWFARRCSAPVREKLGKNQTFVSAPVDGGFEDMTFNDTNFFVAVEREFLFIRKRPDIIPPRSRAYLDRTIPSAASIPVQGDAAARHVATASPATIEVMFTCLNIALARTGGAISLDQISPEMPGPPFFGLVSASFPIPGLKIVVLSGDLRCFKVAAMLDTPSQDYATARQGRHATTLTKVRGWGIWHHREVHLTPDPDATFVTVSSMHDLARLAAVIHQTVRYGLEVS